MRRCNHMLPPPKDRPGREARVRAKQRLQRRAVPYHGRVDQGGTRDADPPHRAPTPRRRARRRPRHRPRRRPRPAVRHPELLHLDAGRRRRGHHRRLRAAHPGVTVDLLYSGSVELEQRIYAERDAGRIRADVIWAANPAFFLKLKAEDLLMAYESPEAGAVPDTLKDPDHMFIAGRVFNMGIGYNTNLVTLEDGAQDLGRVPRVGPARRDGEPAAQRHLVHGAGRLRPARGPRLGLVRAGARGRHAAAARHRRRHPRPHQRRVRGHQGHRLRARQPGGRGRAGGVPLPRGGRRHRGQPDRDRGRPENVEAAKAFVDFIISQAGQQFMVSKFFIPVRTDVEPPAGCRRPTRSSRCRSTTTASRPRTPSCATASRPVLTPPWGPGGGRPAGPPPPPPFRQAGRRAATPRATEAPRR
jgi:iron(III) transport system substrate-binding protein